MNFIPMLGRPRWIGFYPNRPQDGSERAVAALALALDGDASTNYGSTARRTGMAYWITMRRQNERSGFSADTAQEALKLTDSKLADGWDEVRIIDPDGIETNACYLRMAIAAAEEGNLIVGNT